MAQRSAIANPEEGDTEENWGNSMNSTAASATTPGKGIERPVSVPARFRIPRMRLPRVGMPDWRGFLRRHRRRIENGLMWLGFIAVIVLSVVLFMQGDG